VTSLDVDMRTTAIARARMTVDGHPTELLLKLERTNPSGSIKDRTARGLLADLDDRGLLHDDTVVVESTSGNLGLALAQRLAYRGCRFIAVVDPKTPTTTRDAMLEAGAQLDYVDISDGRGGYLLSRLQRVREILATQPRAVWPNQYRNLANPRIHARTTGPEILAQGQPGLGAVYIAVSTGGTLAGISTHLRAVGHPARVVAVDLASSAVTGPATSANRLIPGIGASQSSFFLRPWMYDRAARVNDAEAVALCRLLRADTGLLVGGSSGCVLAAALRDASSGRLAPRSLCVCADGGDRYLDTVFDDQWLALTGLDGAVAGIIARARERGLTFTGLQS
jgi:N-(2-amino-2-carboxyethyl)-L-glutamate synthase